MSTDYLQRDSVMYTYAFESFNMFLFSTCFSLLTLHISPKRLSIKNKKLHYVTFEKNATKSVYDVYNEQIFYY